GGGGALRARLERHLSRAAAGGAAEGGPADRAAGDRARRRRALLSAVPGNRQQDAGRRLPVRPERAADDRRVRAPAGRRHRPWHRARALPDRRRPLRARQPPDQSERDPGALLPGTGEEMIMSLEAAIDALRRELALLQDAMSALRVTITEDRPARGA